MWETVSSGSAAFFLTSQQYLLKESRGKVCFWLNVQLRRASHGSLSQSHQSCCSSKAGARLGAACGRGSELPRHSLIPLLGASTPGVGTPCPAFLLGEQMASAQLETSLPSCSSSQRRCCYTSPTFPAGFSCSVGYGAKVYSITSVFISGSAGRLLPRPPPCGMRPRQARQERRHRALRLCAWRDKRFQQRSRRRGIADPSAQLFPAPRPSPPRCLFGPVAVGRSGCEPAGSCQAGAGSSPWFPKQGSAELSLCPAGLKGRPWLRCCFARGVASCRGAGRAAGAGSPGWADTREQDGEGGQAAAKSLPTSGQAGTQAPQKMPRAARINEAGMENCSWERLMHQQETGLVLNRCT